MSNYSWERIKLKALVESGKIELGRGNIISRLDMEANPGNYPVYSSSARNQGMIGAYGEFMFDEELITWSVDGGGYFFYRPKHRFSVTNVSGYMRMHSNEFDYRYVFYLLDWQHQQLTFDYTYKSHPSVIIDWYFLYDIDVEEQHAIARILDEADIEIRRTADLIDKLKLARQGLLHDLLSYGLLPDGTPRNPDDESLFKDSPLGRIPQDWVVSNIAESCMIHNGLRKPISAEERQNMVGEYPYYGPTGIIDYINEFRVEGLYTLIGEDGDHFLKFDSWEMTQLIDGKFNVNNHAHILSGTDHCRTDWIHCFFKHRDITVHLTRQGAGRFKLNKSTLEQLLVVLPSIHEQIRIISYLAKSDEKIRKEEQLLAKLRLAKKGLTDDLLTGRVRV